jgi:hypothetical protein
LALSIAASGSTTASLFGPSDAISGVANDTGGRVAGVEVSVDGGAT